VENRKALHLERSSKTIFNPQVRFEFAEQEINACQRAAGFLNINNVDLVCLQHEYGIFGGPVGSHILALLRELRMPVRY
jgi:hypothetical protein